MVQSNPLVAVVSDGAVIEVPQSYVDRWPELYKPATTAGGNLTAEAQRADDRRGKQLQPFVDEFPPAEVAAVEATDLDGATPKRAGRSTGSTNTPATASASAAATDGGTPA